MMSCIVLIVLNPGHISKNFDLLVRVVFEALYSVYSVYRERFNRTYREDVLDAYLFNSLDEARKITFGWLEEYNSIRPHASLGNKTPYEFSARIESVYL